MDRNRAEHISVTPRGRAPRSGSRSVCVRCDVAPRRRIGPEADGACVVSAITGAAVSDCCLERVSGSICANVLQCGPVDLPVVVVSARGSCLHARLTASPARVRNLPACQYDLTRPRDGAAREFFDTAGASCELAGAMFDFARPVFELARAVFDFARSLFDLARARAKRLFFHFASRCCVRHGFHARVLSLHGRV